MKPWKRAEYYIAEIVGGRRVPLSGGPGAHHRYDVMTSHFAIEVTTDAKRWKAKWERVCDVAQKEGKTPVLFLKIDDKWAAIVPGRIAAQLIRKEDKNVAKNEPQHDL
jgi:hypothetical protein